MLKYIAGVLLLTVIIQARSPPNLCGPVCAIWCPHGNVLDERGCPTCICKPGPMCALRKCLRYCEKYVIDKNGCQTCECSKY